MDDTWKDDLVERYPLTMGVIRVGFGCGRGWQALLTELCAKIEAIIAAMPAHQRQHYYAVQIKEKLGTLSFYMSAYVPEMDAAIAHAERRSEETCEVCGKPGVLDSDTEHGWVTVKCEPCRDRSRKEREARQP